MKLKLFGFLMPIVFLKIQSEEVLAVWMRSKFWSAK